jgi:hypothetical protein
MKQFLAVFLGSPNSKAGQAWAALDEKTRQERTQAGKEGWGRWMQQNQKSIVFSGGPLGSTKQANPQGLSDVKNMMCAYVVIQGESHDEVAKLFLNHPHFAIFPGDSVEIMETLPIPR